jgi:NAD(P)-binding Rossmann-like domain
MRTDQSGNASGRSNQTRSVEVIIVGAGLSGIGAACRLRQRLPELDFLILESRDAIGGTGDLFRYPGVRSDSDMYSFSYPFRPWTKPGVFASGQEIRTYICDTAASTGSRDTSASAAASRRLPGRAGVRRGPSRHRRTRATFAIAAAFSICALVTTTTTTTRAINPSSAGLLSFAALS